ncbi:golgin subfamily A member 4-like [Boleophthalmus pectinirostris]|uniref:golgin subfamily A member 4-like n=1 Tax=Boleophthalmus pectinirostris TaxID=150288 RepID=UPI0024323D0A|nr:golgin subfamily A member 4-like [Boleophthalmus pectinirostris]
MGNSFYWLWFSTGLRPVQDLLVSLVCLSSDEDEDLHRLHRWSRRLCLSCDVNVFNLKKKKKKKKKIKVKMTQLRIMVFGKKEDKKQWCDKLFNQKTEIKALFSKSHHMTGNWNGKQFIVVKAPDVYSLSEDKIKEEIKSRITLCPPGPHVLLLIVNPSEFNEKNECTLKFILQMFDPDAQKHSVVVLTHDGKRNKYVDSLLDVCEGRYINMLNTKYEDFMKTVEQLVYKHRGAFLRLKEPMSMNLVLCGKEEGIKTSIMKAILGQKMHNVPLSPEQCVKYEGEVCGNRLSVVELLALSGRSVEVMLQQGLRCVSLCAPEGVHAFILVLSENSTPDEDKAELQNILSEVEKERQQRQKELNEKEERIKEEREQREREKKEREEQDRQKKAQEASLYQEWEQKQKALEDKIRSEEQSKETIDKKLQESRKQMEEQQKKWEQERRIWWENRRKEEEQKLQEEEQKLKQLQEEYEEKREKDRIKQIEEDQKRKLQEEMERKKLEEKHQQQIEEMKGKYEAEVRKKAEEFNDFKEKRQKEFQALKQKHVEELNVLKAMSAERERAKMKEHLNDIKQLLRCVSKNRKNIKIIMELLTKQETEMNQATNAEEDQLQRKHEKELQDKLEALLNESICFIL